MKNSLLILAFLFLFCSCDDSKDLSNEELVIGTWTLSTVDVSLTIDGEDWREYFNFPEEEPEDNGNEDLNIKSVKFESDYGYTFEGNDGSLSTGSWSLLENGNALNFSNSDSTENDFQYKILTLTKSNMILSYEETEESDFDDDGTNEELVIGIVLTFEKK